MDRLYRSRSDRMLAGVAGGLAEIWDADPSLVRIIWALLVIFTGGIALLVYIVMAIVVPEEDDVYPGEAAAFAVTPPADATAVTPTAPVIDPVTGQPAPVPPPAPGALWAASPADSRRHARAEARAQRRAARTARGETGSGITPAIVGGIVLVLLGFFFLAREWLPAFDFDWFWPALLILLGVLLLVGAVGRRPSGPSAPSAPPGSTPPTDTSGGSV